MKEKKRTNRRSSDFSEGQIQQKHDPPEIIIPNEGPPSDARKSHKQKPCSIDWDSDSAPDFPDHDGPLTPAEYREALRAADPGALRRLGQIRRKRARLSGGPR